MDRSKTMNHARLWQLFLTDQGYQYAVYNAVLLAV